MQRPCHLLAVAVECIGKESEGYGEPEAKNEEEPLAYPVPDETRHKLAAIIRAASDRHGQREYRAAALCALTTVPTRRGDLQARRRLLVVNPVVRIRPAWGPIIDGASGALASDIAPHVLGAVIRAVLLESERIGEASSNREFEDQLAHRFGLKTRRSLYTGLRCVLLREADGWLTCSPLRHRRGADYEAFQEHWRGKEEVRVASQASDEEWGAAALEALSRSV